MICGLNPRGSEHSFFAPCDLQLVFVFVSIIATDKIADLACIPFCSPE